MATRTVQFKSVFDAIARRHDLDPKGDAILSDAAETICERMNARVDKGSRVWEWPDFFITEERAYRQIWNSTRQFHVNGENGKPDEVFYMPNVATHSLDGAAYYRVKNEGAGDPPTGNLPTDETYWEPIDPLDRYIALDQVCKRPIGEMIGVYAGNPRLTTPQPLCYHISGKGIDVCGYGGLTVFVTYVPRPERYTMVPYIDGKTYNRGDLVYRSGTGECYQALSTNVNKVPENEPTYWRWVQFPAFLAEYVKAGVYADTLRDTDNSDRSPDQVAARRQLASDADAQAEDFLVTEIDWRRAQGQRFKYQPWGFPVAWAPSYPCYCYSPPWNGETNGQSNVTTLTDECECATGYMPMPGPPTMMAEEYHPEIVSLTGPEEPSLQSLDTATKAVASKVSITLVIGGSRQEQPWGLYGGQADPEDPGQVQPHDWNLASNNKHWERLG